MPESGMSFWYDALAAPSGGSAPDLSPFLMDLTQVTSPPTLTPDVQNGNPAWVFSGTNNGLIGTQDFGVQHIFAVAALDRASFVGSEAIVCDGSTPISLLNGNGSGQTKFFNNGQVERYRKNGVEFAASNMQAPINNQISIIEILFSGNQPSTNLNLGVNSDTGAKWKGPILMVAGWDRELSDVEVQFVYEEIAMQFWLWQQQTAGGLDIFPFDPDWSLPMNSDKRVLSSTSVGGTTKSRTKSSKKKGIQPQFLTRRPEEYDAADAFWDQKYPGTHFIYRDRSFETPRDYEMEFVSGIKKSANGYQDIDYSFQAGEA